MQVITAGATSVDAGRYVATIGNFDGVHWGHRALLGQVLASARAQGLKSLAITFWPHPRSVLQPERWQGYLMTLDERLAALNALGFDACLVLPFSTDFAHLSPEQFVQYLQGQVALAEMWVGEDFRFGHRRTGDVQVLRALGEQTHFVVKELSRQSRGSQPVSSALIRDVLRRGDVAHCGQLLDAPYQLTGTIVQGDQRGRTLGFPTANFAVDPGKLLPGRGIYAARISGAGLHHTSAVSIGIRPQFDGTHELVEAFVLDFSGDLYGQRLTLAFVERLRDEQRFDSVEALVTQIQRDVDRARALVG